MTINLLSWTQWLIIGHFVLNMFFALRVIYSKHASSTALAWLVVLFVLPYLGIAAYILFGEPRLGNQRAKRLAEINTFYDHFSQHVTPLFAYTDYAIAKRFIGLSNLVRHKVGLSMSAGNRCQLLQDTDAMLGHFVADIHNARQACLLMFYIVDAQGRTIEVLEALIQAAQRGVACKLLIDDVGSSSFINSEWPARLRENGIEVTYALPVGLFKTLFVRNDLRNHRKLLIVDHQIAYTGSYNLVDPRYFKQNSGVGEWVDVMMRCDGPVALLLSGVFYADWAVENDDNLRLTQQYLQTTLADLNNQRPADTTQAPHAKDSVVQVIPSAPDLDNTAIYETILCALHSALESIVITTPYFVPDEMLLTALTTAAKRGVTVVIILPKNIDSLLVRYASRAYYQKLLESGVELAMFTGGLLHSKTIVIDQQYALFGTVNMDMRSFYLNLEITLAVYDHTSVANIVKLQQHYLSQCQDVQLSKWQSRPIISRFIEQCVRLLSPLL